MERQGFGPPDGAIKSASLIDIKFKAKSLRAHSMNPQKNATLRTVFFAATLFALIFLPAVSLCRASDASTLLGDKSKQPAKPAAPAAPPDVIVFTNGDQLSGTFVREVAGTVTFHSDIVGDINVPWAKIKELRANTKMAILDKNLTPRRGKLPQNLPQGTLSISDNLITVHPDNNAIIQPIPVAKAQYILDEATLNKQIYSRPGFFAAWNGSATAGATIVQATQKQYTFNGAVALVRTIPTLPWLDTNNRTIVDFTGSFGKITQPAYLSEGVFFPATDTKSAIYHADAERDEYFSPRIYALAQTSFDHNFSQGLDLQQIYGGGLGYTVIKRPQQQLDVKATVQYEKQNFINATDGTNQNLIGSTFAGVYLLKLPRGMIFNQQVAYIPAWNNSTAYSATESDTLAIPFYKSLSFSVGTLDSYLNDQPPAVPPTLRNSFQFTLGATYTIKSNY
jgi:hypothetical protein